MAFEALGDKLQAIFKKLRGHSKISERNIEEVLKEIRVSLLEADVNYKVVKGFIEEVKNKAIGQKVLSSVSPSQMMVKIVDEELTKLLGEEEKEIEFKGFTLVMLVGLQGSGKTTSAVKLAKHLKKKHNKNSLLVALDVYRPAAIDQLNDLATANGFKTYYEKDNKDVLKIAKNGLAYAKANNFNVVIFDTAGRLQIDDTLMNELVNIKENIKLDEIMYVVDAMSGQEAVNVVSAFNEKLSLTGVIVSKLDSDARGGSLLSIKYLTGIPIRYAGVGEKVDDFELFYPSRMSQRILGMGDILTFVEKAQEEIDEKEAKKAVNKMMSGRFTLEDMLKQMEQVNKLGSIRKISRFIPGMPKISEEEEQKANEQMKKTKAIISSMTLEERRNPEILKASRKIRVAKGSGTNPSEVNKVLKQYDQTKEMMKQMKGLFKKGGGM